jgi:hypothetical protein
MGMNRDNLIRAAQQDDKLMTEPWTTESGDLIIIFCKREDAQDFSDGLDELGVRHEYPDVWTIVVPE